MNKFVLPLISFQFVIVFSLALVFIIASLKLLYPFTSKENYFFKFAYSYERAQLIKQLNLEGNILDVEQTRNSLFYENNFYSAGREINYFKNRDEKYEFLKKFIKKNNIDFIIVGEPDDIPECLNVKFLETLQYRTQARRNFFVYMRDVITSNDVKLFKINKDNCN